MITVGLIVQFIRAMIKIRSCRPVGIRSVSPFTCKGNMSSTQGGDMRLFRAAYLFQYGRITGHYIINKAADRHVYQADRKVYCFAYLVHDAQANYSAAKMHAIPLSLLFLQPTFLDYFVPRSCASTMVVEHAHMRCPPYLWLYSYYLMSLRALQLSRVRLKRYFIFIYLGGQKTPQFKWISTSTSPHSVFSRSYWGPWRPSAPSSWTTVLRFITARSICWRTACMTNPCQRTRARLKGWKSWSPTTRSAPDEG